MKTKSSKKPKKVAVIMGSKNDHSVMVAAEKVLEEFGISHFAEVVSAHRTPEYMQEFALAAKSKNIAIIIAGAGGAAHLPGMVASLTDIPVIGVPIKATKLDGVDALMSIAQMPRGIPVACVAVDNAHNAGLLAARMLAISDDKLYSRLQKSRLSKRKEVLKNRKIK
jgi:phosphoribosylaminoimidazole carboxylase